MVDVGTQFDLHYINPPTHQAEALAPEPSGKLFAIPTQFVFRWIDGQLKAALRIQVVAV